MLQAWIPKRQYLWKAMLNGARRISVLIRYRELACSPLCGQQGKTAGREERPHEKSSSLGFQPPEVWETVAAVEDTNSKLNPPHHSAPAQNKQRWKAIIRKYLKTQSFLKTFQRDWCSSNLSRYHGEVTHEGLHSSIPRFTHVLSYDSPNPRG